jgi:hypothetical protein
MRINNIRAHYDPEQTTVIHCLYKVGDSSFLGRYAEKKSFDRSNVEMQHFPKFPPYRRGTCPSKDLEIHRNLFPAECARIRYHAQINPLHQNAVGTPQATNHNLELLRKNLSCQSAIGEVRKAVYRSRKMPCTAHTGSIGPEAGKRSNSVRNTKIGRLEPALSRRQGKCR